MTTNHADDCCCDECAATGRICPSEANTIKKQNDWIALLTRVN